MAVADILIPLALDTAYSYAVPDGLALEEGDVVQVPLGTRETVGVVWSLREGSGANFKPVSSRIDAPPLSAPMRGLPRLDRLVHARPEGLGARHGPQARRRGTGRGAARRRPPRGSAAEAHDAGAGEGAVASPGAASSC